ncbi:hypothetical protein [Paraburkholderia sediminicola]|uniref:hypothetical protein n=1 Tax=Paraburkholderia sediminicola TaxID=458836 RepID=UPI0038BC8F17
MIDERTRSAAKAQFDRILVAASILLQRKSEILAGMAREGKSPAQCEAAFARELGGFLADARRAAIVADMPQREVELALFQFEQGDPESNHTDSD